MKEYSPTGASEEIVNTPFKAFANVYFGYKMIDPPQ